MQPYTIAKKSTFYVIGVSYKKADANIRGKFALNDQQKISLLNNAKAYGIESIFVLSTCNRTEIYGFAQHPYELIKLLCENSNGSLKEFEEVSYIYKNNEAIRHLFNVGTGLESQILGDFEIISQIKAGVQNSKQHHLINAYTERLVNEVIQTSKRVKNETKLSSGATSVSFASVQYILKNISDINNKKILLFGIGKIGRNTCENLVKHTKNNNIVLINRTKLHAEKVAGKFNLTVKNYGELEVEIQKSDILIVATGAQNPTIDADVLKLKKDLLILDLSIPKNVDENVKKLPQVTLVHLDELSKITDNTLKNRHNHIPAAKAIIEHHLEAFLDWARIRKFAPTIHQLKEKFNQIQRAELNYQKKKLENFNEQQAKIISNRIIHKITTHFANHLKDENTVVEESIDWIERVFKIESSEI